MILLDCCDTLQKPVLQKLDLEQLQGLLKYGLRLADKCALPTRNWSELLVETKNRYDNLQGDRLARVVFDKQGDSKHIFYDIDYSKGGAFELIPKGKKYISVAHCNGTTVKLTPPLDLSYKLHNNSDDGKAMLLSETQLQEIPIAKLFQKAGKLSSIPPELELTRIGQASPSKKDVESANHGLLMIKDGTAEDDGESALARRPTSSRSDAPPGSGAQRRSARRPPPKAAQQK